MSFKINFLKNPFYYSILFGIFMWLFFFFILPVTIQDDVKITTVLYVLSSYFFLILGFNLFNFCPEPNSQLKDNTSLLIKMLILVVFASFILRWIDLFLIRDLSFDFLPKENRSINWDNSFKSNFIFSLASVIKSLYFFPIVILITLKNNKNKYLFALACFILIFPTVEAILLGTRRPFVELFVLIIITLLISNKLTFNIKQILIISLSILMLLSISMAILINRESKLKSEGENFYVEILSSRYNDKVELSLDVRDFFKNPENPEFLKYFLISLLQVGQYMIHGLFEFNHLVSIDKPEISYGKHTFYPLVKFYNSFDLFEDLELKNYTPRGYVYLTFFGGMYLDFRWFGLLFFLLFGISQKYLYQKSLTNIIYKPLLVYVLMINVFLLSFNFLRGSGLYPIFGFCIFFFSFKLFNILKYEKGISP